MLNSIHNSFKAIFPTEHQNMLSWEYGKVTIQERDKIATFKEFTWEGDRFLSFNQEIAKDFKSFFDKRNSVEIFHKDCDGVMMFEKGENQYMYLSELKSSFSTEQTAKAKKQILSSYLKFNLLLTLTQHWENENIITKGFIISPAPKKAFLSSLKRDAQKILNSAKRHEYNEKVWSWRLISSGNNGVTITPGESHHLSPCKLGERGIFPKITFYFIEVPDGAASHRRSALDFV